MTLYEVTLEVDETLVSALEHYMRDQHIPAIFSTGCFRRICFSQASRFRFRTCYEAESRADLELYLHQHAPGFRAEFQAAFPHGIIATRETWTELKRWE